MITKPLKFKTPAILQTQINKYFEETPLAEWTITGLALALDTSRQVLCDYENNEKRRKYSDAIKKAKLKVENSYELDLKKHGRSGTIFALKNFNWKDKTERDINIKELPKPILGGVNDAELLEPPTVKIIAEDIPSETPLELN